jgi:AraC family transcriptional regulator of adaptative response/methylated-DNA-[protein]-cysteine methyltransferase
MPAKTAPSPTYATDSARWDAVQARDSGADGHFFYSVKTTGVFCRPSCAARPALRKNVAFHLSVEAAKAQGFRPCKRCRPEDTHADAAAQAKVAKACRLIEAAESPPALDDLADAVGLSPFHFHRVFKSITGVTPKAYATAHRNARLRDGLPAASSVTSAIYESGFNSSGRFYENANAILGMTPKDFRAGGLNAEINVATAPCALGVVLVAATTRGICAILLGDDDRSLHEELASRFPKATLITGGGAFADKLSEIVAFIDAPKSGLNLPLDMRGTAFQQKVWQALRAIPPGETRSYAQVAAELGAPKSARAVASACAKNSIAIAIPCHRVVRGNGDLSGYRWGVARKRELLIREGATKQQAKVK